jgi:predicted AAA+ superfamily ATPase
MDIPKTELFAVLQKFNPWWSDQPVTDLPEWERTAAGQVRRWVQDAQTPRALLLTGARQVGKTTIFRQVIRGMVTSGFPPQNIFYATFDHPMLKLSGIENTVGAWEELYPADPEHPRMLFLDEVQSVDGWQTWIKLQADFQRGSRIAATGSASSLGEGSAESGLGRIETIPLPTLSFGEYLRLRKVPIPNLPKVRSLRELFSWKKGDFVRTAAAAQPLTAHFHEYLIRGGFPEPAQERDITRCQRLLREDIVEKALKRDMTVLYGTRRVLELERLFLYLCYNDGGIVDLGTIAGQLEVTKPSVAKFIDLFEATHLVYRLKPFGYGKEVLRGRDKVYLADAAIAGAVMLLGRELLEQPVRLGNAVETAFFKHVFTRYYPQNPRFSYWRSGPKGEEVDLIAELPTRAVPFEIKYQDTEIDGQKLKGLRLFLEKYNTQQAYVITQRSQDFRVLELTSAQKGSERKKLPAQVLAIPAPLACYWLSDAA